MTMPERIENIQQLEDMLSEPTPGAVEAMKQLDGDIMILGVGGKIGPSLARMTIRAIAASGKKRKLIGVERAFQGNAKQELDDLGVETIEADLLDQDQLDALPQAKNIVFMAGMKFGSTGNEPLTWAINTFLPGVVGRHFSNSRIISFGSGNIYGLVPISQGGSDESQTPNPFGEYAGSCFGRERMFEHFSIVNGTPVTLFRLNYAVEMRYGVLVDIAQQVHNGETINLAMGNVNVIWQGDVNALVLQSFGVAASPAFILNVAGPELLSLRKVATMYGQLMGKEVTFEGEEANDVLYSNAQTCHRLFGYPRVGVQQMVHWIADWVSRGGESLGKPSHFEVRDGKF